jgi:hypothetical protein
LLKPIRIHGSIETAVILFNFGFTNDILKENMPKELLYSLGYMKYDPVKYILFHLLGYILRKKAIQFIFLDRKKKA